MTNFYNNIDIKQNIKSNTSFGNSSGNPLSILINFAPNI